MEELVPNDCELEVIVELSVGPENEATVKDVWFDLRKQDFEFDTTWFSSHFHDLDKVWIKQRSVLSSALKSVIIDSFESAMTFNAPNSWLKNKFRQNGQNNQEILNNTIQEVEYETER